MHSLSGASSLTIPIALPYDNHPNTGGEERTILGTMSHQSFPYSTKEEDVYFVDILDHITRVIDSIDIFRDSLRGLMEMQMSL